MNQGLKTKLLKQGCTNPEHQVACAIRFCTVSPNICELSEWNFHHHPPGAYTLKWLSDFWKICTPLV